MKASVHAAGPSLRALGIALEGDAHLRELARSPLMLNIMSRAYVDDSGDGPVVIEDSVEGRRRYLLDKYLDGVFARIGVGSHERAKMTKALSWIAVRMKEHSTAILLVEHIQPSWLPRRWERVAYLVVTRLIVFLTMFGGLKVVQAAPATQSRAGTSVWTEVVAVVFLLVTLLVVEGGAYRWPLKTKGALAKLSRSAVLFLGYFCLSAAYMQCLSLITYGHFGGLSSLFVGQPSTDPFGVLAPPWYLAVAFWGVFGIRSTSRSIRDEIRTARRFRFRPRWTAVRFDLTLGCIAGALISVPWVIVSLVNDHATGRSLRIATDLMVIAAVVLFCSVLGVVARLLLGAFEDDLSPQ